MTPSIPERPDPFEELCGKHTAELPGIARARERARETKGRIEKVLHGIDVADNTSIIAFGSLARREWTSGSDVDWTLLNDGPADPEHFRLVQEIADRFEKEGFRSPGPTDMFGQMSSSHELIHQIGGHEDTNQNLTRRILLLLESVALKNSIPYQRVMRGALRRYIATDPAVSLLGSPRLRVPRFLLNDIVRLWRTFAVDYAMKKWQRSDKGWALRNAKLRMSRKLTFVKGLLLCFHCELNSEEFPLDDGSTADVVAGQLINCCISLAELSPIDMLSQVLLDRARAETRTAIMSAYDRFLELLDDDAKRKHLDEELAFANSHHDEVFQEVRGISQQFRDGLESLFFDDDEDLRRLTRKYGVF